MEENKTNILIVDDEEDVVYCLKNFLARKGYDTEGASSGEEALRKLSEKNIDLILLDIIMPGLKGIEVAKIIREKYPNIKIVVATAFPKESEVLSKNRLTEAVLTKPFSLQELYKKLEEVISGAQPQEADKAEDTGIETRILFVKAKILFVEPSLEVYESLYQELKELSGRGQYYDLDLAIDENELFRKLKFSGPDIVIFEESYFSKLNPDISTNILFNFKKTSEVASFDLASCVNNNEMLEKLYRFIRNLCIKNSLVEIR